MTLDADQRAHRASGSRPRPGSRSRWVEIAVHLFPTGWRERYGVEFGALLDQTPATPRVVFDVLVAAVDAHVHPTGPRRRWPLMIERLRWSELVVFACWVVFVVAGLAFQRMTEGAPFSVIAAGQPVVGWAFAAIVGGAVVSLLAVSAAGIPIAIAIARSAVERHRPRQIGLLAVPPIALAIWLGLTLLLVSNGDPPSDGPWRVVAFLAWVGVFVLAALGSTVAVSVAALEAEVDGTLYRRAGWPAAATVVAMAVVVAAVAVWGGAVAIVAPAAFWGAEGILGTSTTLTWLGAVLVMGGATAVAARALMRARREPAG